MSQRFQKALILLSVLLLPALCLAQSGPENVVLNFNNLPTLDEGVEGHWEGWAIVDGNPVSTGKFNVDGSGNLVELGGGPVIVEFDAGTDISDATAIKISLEPAGDNNSIPSGLIPVAGDVVGNAAWMQAALPDLSVLEDQTTGAYILATPSDDPMNPDNNDQGIWWLTMPGPDPGFLNLPDIGPNWTYEGWVVDTAGRVTPYSTGTFSEASGFDSDMAGPMGGGPPFPGQDFVDYQGGPVLDLDSGVFVAVVSIEPVPDNLPGPFMFKPLAGMIPTDGVGMPGIDMTNQVLPTFPTGTAALFAATPVAEKSWRGVKSLY
jgi:hypothetical protein